MLADRTWDADEMRRAAYALHLLAEAAPNATVATWARIESARLLTMAGDGVELMVLAVGRETAAVEGDGDGGRSR